MTLLLVALAAFQTPRVSFFIGTYTSGGGSKGIYAARLDLTNGSLALGPTTVPGQPALAAESVDPSYLAISPDRKTLFAVHEQSKGSVSAYAISPNGLRLLDTQPLRGSAPCDLVVAPNGKFLFVADYVGGYVESLPIASDGTLLAPTAHVQNSGKGPNRDRQDASHMHCVQPSTDGRFLYSCDLGTDKIQVYRIEPKGEIDPIEADTGFALPGAGPRHAAFAPDGRTLYVDDEMGASVCVFAVEKRTGALTRRQVLPTLPPDRAPGSTAAEIHVHPTGKWVYISNRGYDSITVFKVLPNGLLRQTQIQKLETRFPRGFDIDSWGHWLVVAGQHSHNLQVLAIDQSTGALTPRATYQTVSAPVCVVFPH